MKRYGALFESIIRFDNLLLAARKARRGKQDRLRVAHFYFHLEKELFTLQDELQSGSYRMRPYRSFVIYEPKQRQICAADFRDRVVHHAICHVLEPVVDACLIYDTYACRRGKGTHAAAKRAQHFARRFPYVLKCDVRQYFASIDHAVLQGLLRRKLKDKALLALLDHIIAHPIPGGVPGKGVPIGNLTSQYFANLYLGELDHFVKERRRLKGYVRYMDDFLVFAGDKASLHETLCAIRRFLHHTLLLDLKEPATRLVPVTQGIPFLGFRIFPGLVRVDRKKLVRFRRQVRQREAQYVCGMMAVERLVQSVASMIGHVRQADSLVARRQLFTDSLFLG
jgi:retron-type reverse transcriptase